MKNEALTAPVKRPRIRRTHQDITSEASTLLPCSSTAVVLDLGSLSRTTPREGVEKEYPDGSWFYMFLHNRELKRFIDLFTGRQPLSIKTKDGIVEEHFCYKVFPYTSANHKQRLEKCAYSKEAYAERKDAANTVTETFDTDSTERFNSIVDKDAVLGGGYLFICAPIHKINHILNNVQPRKYLITDAEHKMPIAIPAGQMREFIYLYESMPYNIEIMEHPLEDYIKHKQRIRITSGAFVGKEGCLMRLHRNSHVVFAFGNMTVAISNIHAFPFEKVE